MDVSNQDAKPRCMALLIVEDDEAIRSTMKMALEFENYQVFAAENGKEGLEILPKIPRPCLILLDLMMPVMDGWAFAEALEQDMILASIPVVVVTAFAEKAKTIKKVRGLIKKPIDMDTLLDLVKQYCG